MDLISFKKALEKVLRMN